MRDSYGIGEEAAEFERWRSGWRPDPATATWWNEFTGEGGPVGPELDEAPETAKLCASAFDAVWERATPHEDYPIR